jgi:hypothetical protein
MKAWILVVLVMVAMVMAVATMPASAAEYKDVSGMKPFAAESNYMSLAGYLRWMTFKEQGLWLSMAEAKQIVAEQMAAK